MSIIKIPSKSIYSIDNPIIRKNTIDSIEVNANNTSVQIDRENLSYTETVFTNVANGQVVGQTTYSVANNKYDIKSTTIVQTGGSMPNVEFQLLSYSQMKLGYLSIPIKIYANSYQDKYITQLYEGKDQDGNDRIQYTSDYTSIQLSANGSWEYSNKTTKTPSQYDTVTFTVSASNPVIAHKTGKILNDTLTNDPKNQVSVEEKIIKYVFETSTSFKPQNATSTVTLSVSNLISLEDKTNVSTAWFTEGEDENGKYFAISLNVLVSRTITTLINSDYASVYLTTGDIPNSRAMVGTQYQDFATEVQFTFHGETRFLNVAELIQYIGDTNGKNVFSVSNNELLQTTNTYNGEKAIQKDFGKTLEEYKNGKETATLVCSISDFYDTSGNKVIGIENDGRMMFHVDDEVIPYVYTAKGVDVPMSIDKLGNPKVFKVVGVKPYYDGAVWQELTILEK